MDRKTKKKTIVMFYVLSFFPISQSTTYDWAHIRTNGDNTTNNNHNK